MKLQINYNYQFPNVLNTSILNLVIRIWDLFVIWCLEFVF